MRHAGDDSVGALATGSARVLGTDGAPGGETTYRVRKDNGGEDTWPGYFTIPVSNSSASGRHSVRTDRTELTERPAEAPVRAAAPSAAP